MKDFVEAHARVIAGSGEHVCVPFTPGSVRDLGEHGDQVLVRIEAVVEAHGVERTPEAAYVSEQTHSTRRALPRSSLDFIADQSSERHVGLSPVVLAPKA